MHIHVLYHEEGLLYLPLNLRPVFIMIVLLPGASNQQFGPHPTTKSVCAQMRFSCVVYHHFGDMSKLKAHETSDFKNASIKSACSHARFSYVA